MSRNYSFESAMRETFGSLTVIKNLYFSYVLVSLSVKLTILAEDLYLS